MALITWRGAYIGVLCSSIGLSVAHYAFNCTRLQNPVPIHYDLYGRPNSYVSTHYFVLYPGLIILLGVAGYKFSSFDSIVLQSSDQATTAASMIVSAVTLFCAQVYAARISRGEAQRLPVQAVLSALSILGMCGVYTFLNSVANK